MPITDLRMERAGHRSVGSAAPTGVDGPGGRRTVRHTTHLDGFPPSVTIIRPHHPFEGQTLELLGWSHRHNRLHLLLILPDGSRSLIPAEWTDLQRPDDEAAGDDAGTGMASPPCLGSLTQLLEACHLVEALLERLDAAGRKTTQEGRRATASELPPASTPPRGGVGATQRRRSRRGAPSAGTTDHQGGTGRETGGKR